MVNSHFLNKKVILQGNSNPDNPNSPNNPNNPGGVVDSSASDHSGQSLRIKKKKGKNMNMRRQRAVESVNLPSLGSVRFPGVLKEDMYIR